MLQRCLGNATRGGARVGIKRCLMRVGDGDMPSPQHLPVRSCKRCSSVLQAPCSDASASGAHLSPGRIPGSAMWGTRSRRTMDIRAGEKDRPGVSTNDLFLFFLPRGKRVRRVDLPDRSSTLRRHIRGACRAARQSYERGSRVARVYQTWRRLG